MALLRRFTGNGIMTLDIPKRRELLQIIGQHPLFYPRCTRDFAIRMVALRNGVQHRVITLGLAQLLAQ